MIVAITSIQNIKKTEATNKLNFVQRIVCKLFSITPQTYYYYKVICKVDSDYLRCSDMAVSEGGLKWVMVYVNRLESTLTLESLSYVEDFIEPKTLNYLVSMCALGKID